jgi:hypothetical protein
MTDHPFNALPDRGKPPTSKRHLDSWIQQAQPKTGVAAGRLGWLVASSVEGNAGANVETFTAPSLRHFGLPSAVETAGIVFDYQVAQKLHACTDPHDPPSERNDRARDLVDLLLIRNAFYPNHRDLVALRVACLDLFAARAADAETLAITPRTWPPTVRPHEHWTADYATAAKAADQTTTLQDAANEINDWIHQIDTSS